jgi:ribonuclease PH
MNEKTNPARPGGRDLEALREVTIELDPLKWAEGSAMISFGDTRVLVAASVEDRVPPWRRDSGAGWMTAEYAMLPRSTSTRNSREVSKGRVSGRTAEIQRLIGRSLRAAVDLSAMPERTLTIDCDVIQADGGTRTASVTGAYVAAALALGKLLMRGDIRRWPLVEQVAAVSVGIVGAHPMLDLEYVEDQAAEVDMNVVATASGRLIEIQGTGEETTFTRAEMDRLVDLALAGIGELTALQSAVLAPTMEEVEAVLARGSRKPAAPKDEAEMWGRPAAT